jgi:hypothetical protein
MSENRRKVPVGSCKHGKDGLGLRHLRSGHVYWQLVIKPQLRKGGEDLPYNVITDSDPVLPLAIRDSIDMSYRKRQSVLIIQKQDELQLEGRQ